MVTESDVDRNYHEMTDALQCVRRFICLRNDTPVGTGEKPMLCGGQKRKVFVLAQPEVLGCVELISECFVASID